MMAGRILVMEIKSGWSLKLWLKSCSFDAGNIVALFVGTILLRE
jgi:hypothetical protein